MTIARLLGIQHGFASSARRTGYHLLVPGWRGALGRLLSRIERITGRRLY
jgi:hypothetical protein